jgi:hypothetical protein
VLRVAADRSPRPYDSNKDVAGMAVVGFQVLFSAAAVTVASLVRLTLLKACILLTSDCGDWRRPDAYQRESCHDDGSAIDRVECMKHADGVWFVDRVLRSRYVWIRGWLNCQRTRLQSWR